jgi:hypothetical protein
VAVMLDGRYATNAILRFPSRLTSPLATREWLGKPQVGHRVRGRPSENAERAGFGSAVRARRVTSGVTLPWR